MTAKELRDQFDVDLIKLQESCKHEETEVLEYHPMPGHMVGYVECCKNCEKVIES